MTQGRQSTPAVWAYLRRQRLRAKDWTKLALTAGLAPSALMDWLRFAAAHPVLGRLTEPRVACKPCRPYLDARLGLAQRVAVLRTHYRLLAALGLEGLAARAHARAQTVWLAEGKAGENLSIELMAIHEGHREGEMSLRLLLDQRVLYSLSFVLCESAHGLALQVGRLQGSSADDALPLIRTATRSAHGRRPAALLVDAARLFAQALGAVELRLVGDPHRIVLNHWRRRRMHTRHESLWCDLGAHPAPDGWYVLPVQGCGERDPESVPSRKRAELRRRQLLLQQMGEGIAAWLAEQRR